MLQKNILAENVTNKYEYLWRCTMYFNSEDVHTFWKLTAIASGTIWDAASIRHSKQLTLKM